MLTTRRVLFLLALVCALGQTAQASVISFTVDPTGTATGLTGIAPTTADRGNYNAGSWLALSGSISATASGLTATGNFAGESGQTASGSFPTGNPGSLLSFFGGTLLSDVDFYNNTISFPMGSTLAAGNYDGKYPAVSASPINLTPGIGGGVSGTPGSAPADFGVAVTLKALGFITVASGTGALRNTIFDVGQNGAVANEALSGSLAAQTFATSNNLALGLTAGSIDYNLTGTASAIGTGDLGSTTYTATTDGVGKLTTVLLNSKQIGEEGALANMTLTVPIQVTINETITGSTPATIVLTFAGQFATYATNVSVPEPGSIALLMIAGLALIPVGCRRFRRRNAG